MSLFLFANFHLPMYIIIKRNIIPCRKKGYTMHTLKNIQGQTDRHYFNDIRYSIALFLSVAALYIYCIKMF